MNVGLVSMVTHVISNVQKTAGQVIWTDKLIVNLRPVPAMTAAWTAGKTHSVTCLAVLNVLGI